MASLKALKIRIGSVKSTQKITKARRWSPPPSCAVRRKRPRPRAPMPSGWKRWWRASPAKVTVGESSPKLLAGTGKDQVHLLVVATTDRGLAARSTPTSSGRAPQGRRS